MSVVLCLCGAGALARETPASFGNKGNHGMEGWGWTGDHVAKVSGGDVGETRAGAPALHHVHNATQKNLPIVTARRN
jgi:hypothetical protein